MPYDRTKPKVTQLKRLAKVAEKPESKCEDMSFSSRVLSVRHLGLFYGTDSDHVRNGYGATLVDAIKVRIGAPVSDVWQHRRACFFKPYQSVGQSVVGAFDGLLLPAMTAVQALGLLGAMGSPYGVIGAACFPAAVELISGFVSLGQSLYHKIKYSPNQTAGERARVGEYFQDAVIRIALVIPLAMVSLVTVPAEFIRFFTRCVASLVKLVSGHDLSAHAKVSERTPLLQVQASEYVPRDPSRAGASPVMY